MIKWLKLTVSQIKVGIKIIKTAIVTKLKSWRLSLKKFFSRCKLLTSTSKWLSNIWEKLNTNIFSKKPFIFVKRVATILIFLFSLFLIIDPFMPEFGFRIRHALNVPYKEEQVVVEEEKREINSLVIPAIGVDIPIVEGATDKALREGAWRRPETGTPDKGGNTVLTGHRYQYVPPNNKTFYNLDKLEIGQLMYVYWNEEKYVYEVLIPSLLILPR